MPTDSDVDSRTTGQTATTTGIIIPIGMSLIYSSMAF
jgi:hypothetical protein